MADRKKRLAGNVAGPWFVDSSCIDCDACRQLAPKVFSDGPGHALVARQPGAPGAPAINDRLDAFRAMIACPVGAIRREETGPMPSGLFPMLLEDGVFYSGYNSEDSYGANSYFVERSEGTCSSILRGGRSFWFERSKSEVASQTSC